MSSSVKPKRTNANIGLVNQTPAFVFCSAAICAAAEILNEALANRDTKILYSIKACAAESVLKILHPFVGGFSAASPAEALIASSLNDPCGTLHITSPGLRREWVQALPEITHLAFNSISQCERLRDEIPSSVSLGIRVNPGRSNIEDERYNPCRQYSKLGVPICELVNWLNAGHAQTLGGLHFHNACLCESWTVLRETVLQITAELEFVIRRLKWINLGGGFVWDEMTDFVPLQETVDMLTTRYGLDVFIEPGAGFVNSAGYLVASVIDVIKRDGKTIAILDTTVNHLPEVFEYQFEPDVVEHVDEGRYQYILAGCSCLAGDLFGEYAFDEPLQIGSRLTFKNVGAYSIVKAHTFNGIDLPSIYILDQNGELELSKQSSLDDLVGGVGLRSNEYANS